MNSDTIFKSTSLFLDTRRLCAEGKVPPDNRFYEVLALADDTCAGEWIRYCCETLLLLVHSNRQAAFDFADAVHNTRYLKGLEKGLLMWPQSYWDIEIEPFRTQYGQSYFAEFSDCILKDEEINQLIPDMNH